MLSSLLLRNLPGPVRVFALVGLVFVVGVFGSVAVAATQRALAPEHELPIDSLHQSVGLLGPNLQGHRRARHRRPVAIEPRSLARGVHPPRRAAAPLPETSIPVAPAPAQSLPAESAAPGSHALPPVTKGAPPVAFPEEEATPPDEPPSTPPEENPPVEPPQEEPAAEEPSHEEPPVEPPAEEPPHEEPPVEPPHEEPAPEEPPVQEPPVEPPHEEPAPEEPAEGPMPEEPGPVLPLREAGFESGLSGWNTAGVGEVVPTVVSDIVRTGTKSARVVLTGSQNRSELILGGNGSGSTSGTVEFPEGAEYWYGFSFYILQMVWGHPGAHNIVFQFKSDGTGSPAFALDLWDYLGHRGLWVEGEATGGPNRFVAPIAENAWYDVAIHFKASETGNGFYEVFLDGNPIDSRQNTSMIVPGKRFAYIKDGIYRNGPEIPGTSEIRLDSAKLGTSQASVSP